MSLTFSLSGNSSVLTANFFPAINLEEGEWECALLNFETFYNIYNLKEVGFINTGNDYGVVPPGLYEISDFERIVQEHLDEKHPGSHFTLTANPTTQKVKLRSSIKIGFTTNINMLLGFHDQAFEPNKTYIAENFVNILPITLINIKTSIANGSYVNGERSHVIHAFSPSVPPGYRISEVPNTLIYYPVLIPTIHYISVEITDDKGNVIDFNRETITVRIHLRRKL